ncbi:MAG: XdhC family protein [Planctomycetota bacterium]
MNASRPADDLHAAAAEISARGHAFAMALVLDTTGSTPGKAGAKALIDANGAIRGTIGGGAVEAEALRRAVEAIRTGWPTVFDFDLTGNSSAARVPVCGGSMRVLIDPTAHRHHADYAAAADARQRRRRGVLMTSIRGEAERQVTACFFADGTIPQDLGFPGAEAISTAVKRDTPCRWLSPPGRTGESLEVFFEPIHPNPMLLIFGGGHVGQALAAQAALVGFEIVVIDDRPEFVRPELFPPGTVLHCGDVGQTPTEVPIGSDTYVVIVTRDHAHDAQALAAYVQSDAAYVGMIGSRRKVAMMREDFIQSGRATAAQFDRIHAPIGFNLGAATVPEIAVGILAELIAVRRGARCIATPQIVNTP